MIIAVMGQQTLGLEDTRIWGLALVYFVPYTVCKPRLALYHHA